MPEAQILVVEDDRRTGEVAKSTMEPFFTAKSFGVGLGLPTVQDMMRQHGAGVEGELAQGTTVALWRPLAAPSPDGDTGAAE